MSAKSLLQLILLLLIFLIITGIYYLYFYSGPLKNQLEINNAIDKTNARSVDKGNNNNQEILEDVVILKENLIKAESKLDNKKDLFVNETMKNKSSLKNEIKKNETENANVKNIKNLTKEIEYITSNKNGDIFNILAKYGKTNIKNSSVLDLEEVDGIISSTSRSKVYISSDYAKYNYDNQNSEFYSNVTIKYDNKIITCDNLDLKINENYAIAYNNVVVEDKKSVMKAQIVTLNLVTKDININSKDKVKILTN